MRDDGPNVSGAAAGAQIGAIALQKAMKPNLDKKSAENIIPITINIKGDHRPRTVYIEKGLCIKFNDKESYTIGQDGKIYNARGKVITSINMSADKYGALGGMSQTARENTIANDEYYVLTSQDIREAEDKIHPYVEKFGKRLNSEEGQQAIQRKVNDTQRRLGTDSFVTLNLETGHKDDIDSKDGKFTVKLTNTNTKVSDSGYRYHESNGSVSIFMQNEK